MSYHFKNGFSEKCYEFQMKNSITSQIILPPVCHLFSLFCYIKSKLSMIYSFCCTAPSTRTCAQLCIFSYSGNTNPPLLSGRVFLRKVEKSLYEVLCEKSKTMCHSPGTSCWGDHRVYYSNTKSPISSLAFFNSFMEDFILLSSNQWMGIVKASQMIRITMFINHYTVQSINISTHLRAVFEAELFSTKGKAYRKFLVYPSPVRHSHCPVLQKMNILLSMSQDQLHYSHPFLG